ncbi:MAG TPA: asparagine--tRNA ligase, partial [Syntrophobacteraceae bacterium]|nr:asparagine--tRNA ligase [Syntrophobacteraceae bacterium]
MQQATRIIDIFRNESDYLDQTVRIEGWVRTRRDSKAGVSFIEVNDGSCLGNLQVIVESMRSDLSDVLDKVTTGSSLIATGAIRRSPGKGQSIEMHAAQLSVPGWADPGVYPLQKKRHSFEFLRQIAHLRPRTNTIGAVARVRNRLSFAIHQFFQERGFTYIHTPIITASDCEGAGEVFHVTTLEPGTPLDTSDGSDGYARDFFGKPTYLTVSGQLQAEIYALALGRVYTFGPTFRAENSNTSRHLAEFWMVEPEMAFCDLQGDMELAEVFIKTIIQAILNDCAADLDFFSRFIDSSILATISQVAHDPFEILTYSEAVKILKTSGEAFDYPVEWGMDLQAEHERYLTEEKIKRPVILIHFPRALKPFYMRVNEDDRTVAAMDVLV